ncbi:hypothetical protein LCGC14_2321270, partial [marine sediment metagenome]
RELPFLRQSPGIGGRWGLAPAALLLVAAATLNVFSARLYLQAHMPPAAGPPVVGRPAGLYARQAREFRAANAAAAAGKLALIGDGRAFYFPPETYYASKFDEHPLAEPLRQSRSGDELAERLRAAGVTHVYVAWARMAHSAQMIGRADGIDQARLEALLAGWPVLDMAPAPTTLPTGKAPASTGARRIFTLYAVPSPGGLAQPAANVGR